MRRVWVWSGSGFFCGLGFRSCLGAWKQHKMLSFFLFRFFREFFLCYFCRSPCLRGCLETSYSRISLGTSPSFLVLSWLCLGFFIWWLLARNFPRKMSCCGDPIGARGVLLLLGSAGPILSVTPAILDCVSDDFCCRASLTMYFLFPSLRKPRRFVWSQCDSWPWFLFLCFGTIRFVSTSVSSDARGVSSPKSVCFWFGSGCAIVFSSSSSCSPLLAHDHGEEQARLHDDVTAHPPPL